MKFIENLGEDYIFVAGDQMNRAVTGRISFSLDRGIVVESCSDKTIEKIIEKNNKQIAVVSSTTMETLDLYSVKHIPLDEKTHQKMIEEFPKEPFMSLDASALALFHHGIVEPVELDFEIDRKTIVAANELTTGSMRYPHLLQDLHTRFNDRRNLETTSVCIAGPGLKEEKEKVPFVPQFVELFSLFPEAQFLLLDKDERALKTMSDHFHKCRFASYDPATLSLRIAEKRSSFEATFSDMTGSLAEKAISPQNAKEMLNGVGPLKRVVVKVDPQKIEVRSFDFAESQFKEEKFDLIVATSSISLPLYEAIVKKDPDFDPVAFITKFLLPLKENGCLYVESMMTELFFHETTKEEIETILGNRIRIDKVPVQNFLPDTQGDKAEITSMTGQEVMDKKGRHTLSTHSLSVITRTAEKVT